LLKKHEPSLLLKLKPSLHLKRIIGVVHMLALCACISNSLSIALKCAIFAAIAIHFCWLVRRLHNTEQTIKYTEALGWEISQGNNMETVNILPSTVITVFATFLHIKSQNKDSFRTIFRGINSANKKTILILSDSLDEGEYRCFIVKLTTTAIKQQPIITPVDKI